MKTVILIGLILVIAIGLGCSSTSTSQSALIAPNGNGNATSSNLSISQGKATTNTIELNEEICCSDKKVYLMSLFDAEKYSQWLKPEYHVIRITTTEHAGRLKGYDAFIIYQIEK